MTNPNDYPALTLLGLADPPHIHECANDYCQEEIPPARYALGYRVCLACGDRQAKNDMKRWTVLTPHKQGAMFFTPEFAREAAKGINNKGGLIK